MAEGASGRKLATIVAIDVAGYSRRTEADEDAAIGAVTALRDRVMASAETHGGRVFNTAGDGFMLEFPSASSALAAAEEIAAAGDPPVRIGVHLGEVSVTASGDILGHGVNVAARIQQAASPGAVLVSGDVKRAIRGPLGDRLRALGSVHLDKMSETLPVFALAPAAGGPAKGRRRNLRPHAVAGLGLVAALLALLALWLGRESLPWGAPRPDRIAILPFSVAGSGDDVRAFATGLTNALQGVLSGNGMPTVSASDAAGLGGPDRQRLVRALGVRLILDGAAERDGDSLEVRARLDDARRRITLWSAELRGPANQPVALQAQIGARIIAVLNCSSRAMRPKGGLSDPAAISLLLKACDLFEAEVGLGDNVQALSGMLDAQRALTRLAPDFAAGHSALAKYLAVYRYAFPADAQPQLTDEARREARKALAIDPDDEDGRLALYLLQPMWDFTGRGKAILSLPFDPAWPYADIFKAGFLQDVGRLKDSQVFAQRAVAANPLSDDTTSDIILAWNGQVAAARQELERLERLWPGTPLLWPDRIGVYSAAEDWTALEKTVGDPNLRPRTMTDADVALLRLVFRALRSRDPALLAQARSAMLAAAPSATGGPAGRIAYLAWMGFVDDAFDQAAMFGKANLDLFNGTSVLFSPQTANLRRDPRFMPLAAKLGLADYWRSTGDWPDFCFQPDLPYDCKAEAAKLAVHPAG